MENEIAKIRIELMELEELDNWNDYEFNRYLDLKLKYFKLINQK